jgi:uncharacterized protein (TIRG00374 family)
MLKVLLKLIISAAILAILVHEVQWDSLKIYFQSLQWNYFVFALLSQLLSAVIAAGRWSLLMDALGFVAPLRFYMQSYFKGVMFNQVLPSSIGGDAYRIIEVHQHTPGKKLAVLSVLVDRIYGIIGLALLTLISLPWVFHILPLALFKIMSFVTFLILLGTFFLLCLNMPVFGFLSRIIGMGLILDLAKQILRSFKTGKDLFNKTILSIFPHLLTVYSFYLLTKGLPISVSFSDYVVIIPAILLLPCSLFHLQAGEYAKALWYTLVL